MGDLSPYFSRSEFSCGCSCGFGFEYGDVDVELLALLDRMREILGAPIYISHNGGCRCGVCNEEVGGVDNSAHSRGMAADLKVTGGWERRKMIDAAVVAGAAGIGVANGFVHVDVCDVKPRPSAWGY